MVWPPYKCIYKCSDCTKFGFVDFTARSQKRNMGCAGPSAASMEGKFLRINSLFATLIQRKCQTFRWSYFHVLDSPGQTVQSQPQMTVENVTLSASILLNYSTVFKYFFVLLLTLDQTFFMCRIYLLYSFQFIHVNFVPVFF